jgi:hypothetical protein
MAYTTGTFNAFSDVLTALRNACVSAGWTLNGGRVLSKGTAFFDTLAATENIGVRGGTGYSGGALTGAAANWGYARAPRIGDPMAFPATYHIQTWTGPDEVYLIINWSASFFTHLAFGQSPVPGLPGLGSWFTGGVAQDFSVGNVSISTSENGNAGYNSVLCPAPFWPEGNAVYDTSLGASSFVHHGLDGAGWSARDGNYAYGTSAFAKGHALPMLARSPNAWNGETVLCPILVTVGRPSGRCSLVAQLANARYVRLDNLEPGQIITLGGDQWKPWPFYRRDASFRDGNGSSHSGTLGWAIRYGS